MTNKNHHLTNMYIANFTHSETLSPLFRLRREKVLNKYFWEKEKAEVVEKLSRQYDIPKTNILVEDISTTL